MTAPALVAVGTSLGGLRALQILLRGLPVGFPPAVIIVQHRGRDADDVLVKLLQRSSALPISEPEDKEGIVPGRVYLAPSDYHILVERDRISLSTEELVHYARPSIDVLFESAAGAYGAELCCVVLTGANQDGARGAGRVKAQGGIVIAQDPDSAESRAMPQAAIAATKVDAVLPLEGIAPYLVALCQR
jgi:two-component system, chemotaxis family, protein-glutamate methylesterase/glutaminase